MDTAISCILGGQEGVTISVAQLCKLCPKSQSQLDFLLIPYVRQHAVVVLDELSTYWFWRPVNWIVITFVKV